MGERGPNPAGGGRSPGRVTGLSMYSTLGSRWMLRPSSSGLGSAPRPRGLFWRLSPPKARSQRMGMLSKVWPSHHHARLGHPRSIPRDSQLLLDGPDLHGHVARGAGAAVGHVADGVDHRLAPHLHRREIGRVAQAPPDVYPCACRRPGRLLLLLADGDGRAILPQLEGAFDDERQLRLRWIGRALERQENIRGGIEELHGDLRFFVSWGWVTGLSNRRRSLASVERPAPHSPMSTVIPRDVRIRCTPGWALVTGDGLPGLGRRRRSWACPDRH